MSALAMELAAAAAAAAPTTTTAAATTAAAAPTTTTAAATTAAGTAATPGAAPTASGAPVATRLDYADHPAFADVPYFGAPEPTVDVLARAVNHLFAAAADPGFNPAGALAQACDRAWQNAALALSKRIGAPASPRGKFVAGLLRYAQQLMLQDLVTPMARAVALPAFASAPVAALTERLYSQGYSFVTLPAHDVAALHAVVNEDAERFRALARQGAIRREQLSRNQWESAQHAALGAVFGKADVLDALSRYMGREVAYDGTAFEVSVPGTQRWTRYGNGHDNLRTLYTHLDRTSHAPKAIFYLSTVTADRGPTRVNRLPYADQPFDSIIGRAMDNSALHELITAADGGAGGHLLADAEGRAVFAALPPPLRRLAHFGHDIPHHSMLEREVLAHETTMLGAPGTGVIFDGARVPHRGGIVTEGERLAFQVIYRCKGALNDAD